MKQQIPNIRIATGYITPLPPKANQVFTGGFLPVATYLRGKSILHNEHAQGVIHPSIQVISRIPQIHDHGLSKLLTVCLIGELLCQLVGKGLERASPDIKGKSP